jgi:hypothetical protein
MPTIKTLIDDDIYAQLVRERKKAGVPSISALFLKKCGVLTEANEAGEIVRRAFRRAKTKGRGFEFRLRDAFTPRDWENFSKGARLRAGRLFQEQIGTAVHGIRASRKSSSGHQFYIVAERRKER